ncbi:MAG: ATP-dependent metallopeptidase FtsH/Yme1/Tma family protein, partial [Candidatus Vecturithrix sp.]|nr:ATP-dependent metallopeptidase FtsH/Yme1/Tma family protein [Candidatus Vecturithrix sp.]
MNPFYKNIALWLVIGIIVVLIFDLMSTNKETKLNELPFSDFMQKVERNEIREIAIVTGEQMLKGKSIDGKEFKTYIIVDSF